MSTAPRWQRPPLEVVPDAPTETPSPAIASLAVSWRVSRSALGDRVPAGSSRLVRLTVRVASLDADARAEVFIEDPTSGRRSEPLPGASVAAEVIPDIRGHIHIEVPGWLHATIEAAEGEADSWRLIYTRTPLLAALGIRGGRAEPAGVEVE